MSTATSGFNRALVFLAGLVLIAAGLVPAALYWPIPWVSEQVSRLDRAVVGEVPAAPWFTAASVAALIILLVLGVWLVVSTIRNRAFSFADASPTVADQGTTVLNLQRIGEAACKHLESNEMVDSATVTVSRIGRRPTATFRVVAQPSYRFADVAAVLEAADRDLADALPGTDLDTVYKLELDRVTR